MAQTPDPKDAAQATLDDCDIEPGQVFRHYKGGLYSIVAVGIKEDTLEPLVVYRSNRKGTTWVRTLDNFTERMVVTRPRQDGIDGSAAELTLRFQRMES